MRFNDSVRVLKKVDLNKEVFQLVVERKEAMGEIKAGQFFNLKAAGVLLNRPISVSDFNEVSIEFTIKILGEGTAQLHRLQEGESLALMGPLGNGFECVPAKKILLVGGGIGIAPLKRLCYETVYKETTIHTVLGFREQPYLEKAFAEKSALCHFVSETDSAYELGFVTAPLERLLSEHTYDQVFVCGPMPMLKAVSAVLAKKEVDAQLLMEEKMACGVGACLVCTCKIKEGENGFKHKRMCKDGPMFYASEVVFDD
ncbi:dihydroorotate dehydrogenase electron transfer subunit [Fusibacter sp. JL298sf-3]